MNLGKVMKKMITVLMTLAMVLSFITPLSQTSIAEAAVTAPSLNADSVTIVVGKSFNFNVNNKIKGATYKWKSYNEDIVQINANNGIVTGVKKGSTLISCTIKTPDKKSYKLRAEVDVRKPAVSITISNKIEKLKVNETYTLKKEIIPATSNDLTTWSSSDESIIKSNNEGEITALKTGTATITAITVSGRSDSVTIKVIGDETETEKTESSVEEAKVLEVVLKEDFSSSTGGFKSRGGSEKVEQTTSGKGSDGEKGYIKVSGRSATWNGATLEVIDKVVKGATYKVTGWVRYMIGEDTEKISLTQQRVADGDTTYIGIGSAEVKKGEWTEITGLMEIAPSSSSAQVYFEASTLIDFFIDTVTIERIEAEQIVEEEVVLTEVSAGDIVFKNDFEEGAILDTRAGSERVNTTDEAHSGKASVMVSRTGAWDGAGVRFSKSNNIVKANYFGKTLHVSAYVKYNEGPATVDFKLNNQMSDAAGSDSIPAQITVTKGEWTLIEADCYIEKNTEGSLIFFETEGEPVTFYVDDMEIKVAE